MPLIQALDYSIQGQMNMFWNRISGSGTGA